MINFVKRVIVILLLAVIFCVGLGAVLTIATKDVYKDNYQKGYVYQYRRLQQADESQPKIIAFGGSYLTFSLDTKQMEKITGVPTYELGVQSNMGMSYSIELIENSINKGDIVVFPFEDYVKDEYGMDLIYISIESEPDMLLDFLKNHPKELLTAWPRGIYRRVAGLFRETSDPYYIADGFDSEYAYYKLDRPEPLMTPEELSKDGPSGYAYTMEDVDPSCIESLNELNTLCEKKGAKLVITYSPMCVQSVFTDIKGRQEYMDALQKALDADIICTLDDCFYDAKYVFNGNKHLNTTGMELYTDDLSKMLEKYLQ